MSSPDTLKLLLAQLVEDRPLSEPQAEAAFECVMSGSATPAQIGALLTAIRVRAGGPTADELTGAARTMRRHATRVPLPVGLQVIDTCGTGGDASGTFNISTAAALIAAGAGAKVAKHGNRSVTSRSGSSQVLETLGVNLEVTPETLVKCLLEAGLCFCFAPRHHPAMKHAAAPRQELGFRTIFNLLGPLTNPAGADRQVMGVYDPRLTERLAEVLGRLGSREAMVVHGDGLDELTITGPSRVSHWKNGRVETRELDPRSLGLKLASVDTLQAESPEDSARVIRSVLGGEEGPARDIALLNAAAALVVAGRAADFAAGLKHGAEAIDSGAALGVLEKLIAVTRGPQ